MIYTLECETNKYYVGSTTNLEKRVQSHIMGTGCEWTKKYKPLDLLDSYESTSTFDELKTTLEMMSLYGIENVRGANFISVELNLAEKVVISKMLKHLNNGCFNCNEDHYTKDCKVYCRICQKLGHLPENCKLLDFS